MKKNLLFVAVMLALVANDVEARVPRLRQRVRDARERFWQKYEDVVFRVLDEIESWKTQPEE